MTEQFAEVLICDGRSIDNTLLIAKQAGARVIEQSSDFMDGEGRLVDYSGVRNQMLQEANYDWQFHLDSDEILTKELVSEIRELINKPDLETFVYLVPRKYYLDRDVIDCATQVLARYTSLMTCIIFF